MLLFFLLIHVSCKPLKETGFLIVKAPNVRKPKQSTRVFKKTLDIYYLSNFHLKLYH